MRALGLDTATNTASVAVVELAADGGFDGDPARVLAAGSADVSVHSANLLGLIQRVIGEAGVALAQIDAYVGGAGPGSFTGLRIGLATIKGLAYATGKPLWLASSLAAILPAGPRDGQLAASPPWITVLDARRGEVYVAWFARQGVGWQPRRDAYVTAPEEFAAELAAFAQPVVLLGDGAQLYREVFAAALPAGSEIDASLLTPSAVGAIAWACQTPLAERTNALFEGAPTYVRLGVAPPPVR